MRSVKRECRIEFEEKKSKFIGYIKPVGTKAEAEKFIASIKERHPDATHNCSVYKLQRMGRSILRLMMMENHREQQENLWEKFLIIWM